MTLSREEASDLRQWSSRLIQALQILDLEVDHEKIIEVAEQSVRSVGPARRCGQCLHRGIRGGHSLHPRTQRLS
ncbi:hypothetical protein [Arthrobacter sp. PAMC25284]|uniref:hypothetical protein n=1 Tax=Arthrobacter sp. PAMC25284 TaxID=2861279 RepID=UPI0021598411|nr:hypothetical protein [Arthrobacter sp. PAMC25284]